MVESQVLEKKEDLARHLPELVNGVLCPVYARPTPIRKLCGKPLVLSWHGEHPRGCEWHRAHIAAVPEQGSF